MIRSRTTLDERLFASFALANLAGHHADDGWEFGGVRRSVRVALAPSARRWSDALDVAGLKTAIKRAGQTLRYLQWFEVVQTRGHIENGEVKHYQVVLKAGFTLEGEPP